MPTSKYFNVIRSRPEKALYESLADECIRLRGIDAYYLPRQYDSSDRVLMEASNSYFNEAFLMAVLLQDVTGFEGEGNLFSQFGIQIEQQMTLQISEREFLKCVGSGVPKIGDLIYIPLGTFRSIKDDIGKMLEIKFVGEEDQFYMHGQNTTFSLRCEMFTYSSESFGTGIPEIDSVQRNNAYKIEVVLSGGSESYEIDETVMIEGGYSAKVAGWDVLSNTISLVECTAEEFPETGNVIGDVSGAIWEIQSSNSFSFSQTAKQSADFQDDFDENLVPNDVDNEWDDSNPWGEY